MSNRERVVHIEAARAGTASFAEAACEGIRFPGAGSGTNNVFGKIVHATENRHEVRWKADTFEYLPGRGPRDPWVGLHDVDEQEREWFRKWSSRVGRRCLRLGGGLE
eukprot:6673706-Pyramimonas_sp.AAC.1